MKHTLANLQDLIPTFGRHNYKQGLNLQDLIPSCRFTRVCFICACTDVPTQLELCLYDQLDIASLLLDSLCFITIHTPFLIFSYFYIVCLLFIAHWDLN